MPLPFEDHMTICLTRNLESLDLVPRHLRSFVRRGGSWHKLHDASFGHRVERPLGIRDGQFLYMEARCNTKRGQLIVFDLSTNDLKKLNIFDLRGNLDVFCYDEIFDPLPGAVPMRYIYHS